MSSIHDNLQAVLGRIARAAEAAGRDPGAVTLLAVSKNHPAALVEEAFAAGQRAFGENYVQEAVEKMDALAGSMGEERARALEWHLIGPLQSNKTRIVAGRFDWVHSVESGKTARRLSEQRPRARPLLNILIQVNVSGEASKSGVAPEAVAGLAIAIASLPNLRLRGLMAIPEPGTDTRLQRSRFATLKSMFDALKSNGFDVDTLSMGMSGDMDAAIAEGASMVRIGTAIFGARRKERSAA